jgi:hypothetical protein
MLVRKEKCGIKTGNIMKCGETFQVSKLPVWKECETISNMYIHT